MNDIECATCTYCFHDCVTSDVAIWADRSEERIDIALVEVGDHVDVIRGSRFAMHRARERTADHIRDAESSQDASN